MTPNRSFNINRNAFSRFRMRRKMMSESRLGGVIAAVATATNGAGEPDCMRSTALARFLLDNGCDGLNVLGTTGEATSYGLSQRQAVMNAYRSAGLPLDRMMVGTGAAAA